MTEHRELLVGSGQGPVACTLTTKEQATRAVEWSDLRGRALSATRVEGGVALSFPIELADVVEDLAAREATCCTFLALATTRRTNDLRLVVTSENPEAGPVIDLVAGFVDD